MENCKRVNGTQLINGFMNNKYIGLTVNPNVSCLYKCTVATMTAARNAIEHRRKISYRIFFPFLNAPLNALQKFNEVDKKNCWLKKKWCPVHILKI